jgi:nitrite reductase/ring-hydroxylating ferredoxin subunit
MIDHPETSSPLAQKLSRRAILRMGCIGTVVLAAGTAGVAHQTGFINRIQGATFTPLLEDNTAWSYADGELRLSLTGIPELAVPGSAVRLESDQLPEDLLLVHGVDEQYYLYANACTHGGRKIDLDGSGQLTCTSLGQSRFDYSGAVQSGPAPDPLTTYTVAQQGDQLIVTLS